MHKNEVKLLFVSEITGPEANTFGTNDTRLQIFLRQKVADFDK